MKDFRFVRKNWKDETVRDYLDGAIKNAKDYAAKGESNGDYIVRFRESGGGVYIAYWEEDMEGMSRRANVEIGSPSLKAISWRLCCNDCDLLNDSPATLYWCPREKGMPYAKVPSNLYMREWCLYEGIYKWARLRGWNEEGHDGKPKHRIYGEPGRSRVVDEMLELSKMGGKR